MSGLEKRVFHDCEKPVVEDAAAEHRWTCECGTQWEWKPSWITCEVRSREHWWSRPTISSEPVLPAGGYWSTTHRTSTWQSV